MNRRGLGSVYRPKYVDKKTGITKQSAVWWVGVSYRGKQHRESSESKNRNDAVRLLRKRMEEMGRGRLIGRDADRLTFDDLAQMLKSDYQTNGRKSLKRAEVALKSLKKFFGFYRALDLMTDRITEYVRHRQEEGIKPATIHYELAVLKKMFNLAIRAEKLDRKPYIPSIEVRNTRSGFFSEKEYRAVVSRLPDEVTPLISFLWLTGWRKMECLNLEWRHIDWESKTVRLDPGTTKNDEGRVFPFGEYCELENLLTSQRAYTETVQRETGQIIPWIFHRQDGKKILDFRRSWESACRDAGCPGRWVHDFRRSGVRRMEQRGVPRSWAMKLTGHKTESIYRRYAIVSEADLSEGVSRLSDNPASIKVQSK